MRKELANGVWCGKNWNYPFWQEEQESAKQQTDDSKQSSEMQGDLGVPVYDSQSSIIQRVRVISCANKMVFFIVRGIKCRVWDIMLQLYKTTSGVLSIVLVFLFTEHRTV